MKGGGLPHVVTSLHDLEQEWETRGKRDETGWLISLTIRKGSQGFYTQISMLADFIINTNKKK
jgi:hypothetical protein